MAARSTGKAAMRGRVRPAGVEEHITGERIAPELGRPAFDRRRDAPARREGRELKPMMNERGKSDPAIVAANPANKAEPSAAEPAERRAGTKGNADQQHMGRTQSRETMSQVLARIRQTVTGNADQPPVTGRPQGRETATQALERIRQTARKRKKERFTALYHHITPELLRSSFLALTPEAAPGVDGMTWQDYAANLESNLEDLHARVQRGAYRALPSRRQYIPKPDGRQRPLAVAALEDKIVQRAMATLLNAIYEEDFLGFSYGFRPGRGTHDAMDALVVGIESRKVNWILDADIRAFLDRVSYYTLAYEAWSKRLGCEHLSLRRRPFLRPCLTWMASISPRLTRCHTDCREMPSWRIA